MKKILWILMLCIVGFLLYSPEVLAAPEITFTGSEIWISGAYTPERYWTDHPLEGLGIWGVGGTICLNICWENFTLYSSVGTALYAYCRNLGAFYEWGPLLQDYYWKVVVGAEFLSRLRFEIFAEQYCLHEIDASTYLAFTLNQYTSVGGILRLRL